MKSNCLICEKSFIKRIIGQNTCSEICEIRYEIRRKVAYSTRNVIDFIPMRKRCVICQRSFIAERKSDVTCGNGVCIKMNMNRVNGLRPDYKQERKYYLEKDDLSIENALGYSREKVKKYLK